MTKEDFNKVWKDSTREEILNQYYYDYIELQKQYRKVLVLDYIIDELDFLDVWNNYNTSELLEIIKGENNE